MKLTHKEASEKEKTIDVEMTIHQICKYTRIFPKKYLNVWEDHSIEEKKRNEWRHESHISDLVEK